MYVHSLRKRFEGTEVIFPVIREIPLNEKCLNIEKGDLMFYSAITFVSTQILSKLENV